MHKGGLRIFAFTALALLAVIAAGCGGKSVGSTTGDGAASAPFDRAFIDAMVPHHLSAIDMAQAARDAGLHKPVLVGIANDIVTSQQREIDEMQQWRKQWYGSAKIDPNDTGALGMSTDEMGMSHSPGDISKASNVDVAFASLMTDHHKGAVAMAKLALMKARHPEIKKLARQIIAAQERELRLMKPYVSRAGMGGMHM